ncbi:MAG: 4'-phosphopantetheinyl transferase superfamily protein [Alphaproteobacteria bacterium]|nr:4'-phosphopantetheinyl transferase superfamily protein [Alphaproteobacteria bacterium]
MGVRLDKSIELIVERAKPCLSMRTISRRLEQIPSYEAERLRNVVCARTATNSLHGLRLMQEVAEASARSAGAAEDTVRIVRDDRGKPHIKSRFGGAPEISLSHCRAHVVLAISQHSPIGVDIEGTRELRAGLLDACCLPRERAWVERADNEQVRRFRFSWLWTLKEAFMKAVGLGLAIDPRELEFSMSDRPRLITSPRGTHCRFLSFAFCGDSVISLCLPYD